jgi:serine/threonine protein kinase
MVTVTDPPNPQASIPIPAGVGAEPIPGYQLTERLGSGGYGEVWKATAPGGIDKAVKIIYGDLSGPRAEQELRALERIKSVRHPFLLSLERFEVASGKLVIVTELADRSLMQRFHQCREAGQPGIPRDELIGYLREAADCLDYLSETHGLQHLDIKPENLLLVGNHMKVADFGLVKNLLGSSASITGGVTPIYATPEAFAGRASRYSDQYSLAIVYQEMLTGERPFPGTTPFQLLAQHTSAAPVLDALPPADRPAIARALSKVPDQRFPLCRDMIEALRVPPPTAASVPADPPTTTPAENVPGKPFKARKTMVGGIESRQLGRPTLLTTGLSPDSAAFVDSRATLPPDALVRTNFSVPLSPPAGRAGQIRTIPTGHESGAPGGYRPTLYVGLGGLAGRVLRRLKRRLNDHFAEEGHPAAPPCLFRFLHVDTDRMSLHLPPEGSRGAELSHEELLHCPLRLPEQYRDQTRTLFRWLARRFLYGIPRSLRTEGLRPLGRLAFVDHAEAVLASLREGLRRLTAPESRAAAAALGLREEAPHVVIVAAVTGGTGGGMLIDAAEAVRQALRDLGLPEEICGMLLFAGGARADEAARARINAYATLQELWHWSRAPAAGGKPPFRDCYILGDPGEGAQESRPDGGVALADQLAEYLSFDATAGGGCLERLRVLSREAFSEHGVAAGPMTVRTCGLTSVRFPRRQLLDSAASVLCRRVAEHWHEEVPVSQCQRLGQLALDWVRQEGLSEEALLKRLLGRLPSLLTREGSELYEQLSDGRAVPPAPGTVAAAKLLGRLDAEFGPGPEPDATAPGSPAPLDAACQLEAREVASGLGQAVVGRLRGLVEDPVWRLRGGAAALAAVSRYLADEVQNTRGELDRLRAARRQHRRRLEARDTKVGGLLPPRVRRLFGEAPAVERPLWDYFCLRVEEMLTEAALDVLVRVGSSLSGMGQDLETARCKLAEFLAGLPDLEGSPPPAPQPAGDAPLLELWPGGAADAASGRARFLQELPADLEKQFDDRVQREVLDPVGGLWEALKEPGATLAAQLTRQAGAFLAPFLDGVDLTLLLHQRYGEGQPWRQALQDRVRAAGLTVPGNGPWEHLVLAVPEGPTAAPLRDAALEALVGVPVTLLDAGAATCDELLVAREAAGLALPELAARFAGDDPAVVELAEKVRTRQDVAWERF